MDWDEWLEVRVLQFSQAANNKMNVIEFLLIFMNSQFHNYFCYTCLIFRGFFLEQKILYDIRLSVELVFVIVLTSP